MVRNGPYELVVAPLEYPGKKYRDKYVYEHHLVWWRATGCVVPEDSVIHHKDENKRRNTLSNLELKTRADHVRDHNEIEPVQVLCGFCGNRFQLKPNTIRNRLKQSKSGRLFCSRLHSVKFQYLPG